MNSEQKPVKMIPCQGLPNYYAVVPKDSRPIIHCPEFYRHMTREEKISFVNQLARIDPGLVLHWPVRREFEMPKPNPRIRTIVRSKRRGGRICQRQEEEELVENVVSDNMEPSCSSIPPHLERNEEVGDRGAPAYHQMQPSCSFMPPLVERTPEVEDREASTSHSHQMQPSCSFMPLHGERIQEGVDGGAPAFHQMQPSCSFMPSGQRIQGDVDGEASTSHQRRRNIVVSEGSNCSSNRQLHNGGLDINQVPLPRTPTVRSNQARETLKRKRVIPQVAKSVEEITTSSRSLYATAAPMNDNMEPIGEPSGGRPLNEESACYQNSELRDDACEIVYGSSSQSKKEIESKKKTEKTENKEEELRLVGRRQREAGVPIRHEDLLNQMPSTSYNSASTSESEPTLQKEFEWKCDFIREQFRKACKSKEVEKIKNLTIKLFPNKEELDRALVVVFDREAATPQLGSGSGKRKEVEQSKSKGESTEPADKTVRRNEMDEEKTEIPSDETVNRKERRTKKEKKTRKLSFSFAFVKCLKRYIRKIILRNRLARFLKKKIMDDCQIDEPSYSLIASMVRPKTLKELISMSQQSYPDVENYTGSDSNPTEAQLSRRQLVVFSIKKEKELIKQIIEMKSQASTLCIDENILKEHQEKLDKVIYQKQRKIARVEICKRFFQIVHLIKNGKNKMKKRKLIKELRNLCQQWPETRLFPRLIYSVMKNKRRVEANKYLVIRNLFTKIAEVKRLEEENDILKLTSDCNINTSYDKYLKDKNIKTRIPISRWKQMINMDMKKLLNPVVAEPDHNRELNAVTHFTGDISDNISIHHSQHIMAVNESSHSNSSEINTNTEATEIDVKERLKRFYKKSMYKVKSQNRMFKKFIHDDGLIHDLPRINPIVLHYAYINKRLKFAKEVSKLLCFSAAVSDEISKISTSEVTEEAVFKAPITPSMPHFEQEIHRIQLSPAIFASKVPPVSREEFAAIDQTRVMIPEPPQELQETETSEAIINNDDPFTDQIPYIAKEKVPITKELRQTGRRDRPAFRDTMEKEIKVMDLLRNYSEETKKNEEQGLREELAKRQKLSKLSDMLGGDKKKKRTRETEKTKPTTETSASTSHCSAASASDLPMEPAPRRSCDNVQGFLRIGNVRPCTVPAVQRNVPSRHTLAFGDLVTPLPLSASIIAPGSTLMSLAQQKENQRENVTPPEKSTSSSPNVPQVEMGGSSTSISTEESGMSFDVSDGDKEQSPPQAEEATETGQVEPKEKISDEHEVQEQSPPQAEGATGTGQVEPKKKRYVTPYALRKPRKRVRHLTSDDEMEESDDEFTLPGYYKRRKTSGDWAEEDRAEQGRLDAERKRRSDRLKELRKRTGDDDEDEVPEKQIKQETIVPEDRPSNSSMCYNPSRVKAELLEIDEEANPAYEPQPGEIVFVQAVQGMGTCRLPKVEPLTPNKYPFATEELFEAPRETISQAPRETMSQAPRETISQKGKSKKKSRKRIPTTKDERPLTDSEVLLIMNNLRVERLLQEEQGQQGFISLASFIIEMDKGFNPHRHGLLPRPSTSNSNLMETSEQGHEDNTPETDDGDFSVNGQRSNNLPHDEKLQFTGSEI